MNLKELSKVKNEVVERVDLMVVEKTVQLTKSGKEYLVCKGQDKTGEVMFRIWDPDDDINAVLTVGNIVSITLNGKLYNNAITFEMAKHTKPTLSNAPKSEFTRDFCNSHLEENKDYLRKKVLEIKQDENLRPVIDELFNKGFVKDDLQDKFFIWPAAETMHHAEKSGLLYHTTSIMKIAEGLIERSEGYGLQVNKNLVMLSILLHDFFKTKEYEMEETSGKGLITKYALIGHIAMAQQFIGALYYKGSINQETYIQLSHVVGSHHGKPEWGSATAPATIEAMIVHLSDYADSRLYMFMDAISKLDKGEYSATKCFGLDNARIYNPADLDTEEF